MNLSAPTRNSRWVLILSPLVFLGLITIFTLQNREPETPASASLPSSKSILAALGLKPDWSDLDRFQNTISRKTFLNRLETLYTKDDSWRSWININKAQNHALIGNYQLNFSSDDKPVPGSIFDWNTLADLSDDRALPLDGLVIAIDPGHIGGDYAKIEEREHEWGDITIREGSMTLKTAKLLKPMLEEFGASVTLVRSTLEPVTKDKAKDFANSKLFYRTSEIRARAELINQSIKPDLVICLHFNGSGSQIPVHSQHFHIILNGTYTASELAHEDQRFEMLQRLLSGTITEELPLAHEVASAFNERIKLPAYRYPRSSLTSQNLANHPNLWARNLLANRLYQCPVIFLEPYVMNSVPFITRFRKNPTEIYREYAQAVADGITRYYSLQ